MKTKKDITADQKGTEVRDKTKRKRRGLTIFKKKGRGLTVEIMKRKKETKGITAHYKTKETRQSKTKRTQEEKEEDGGGGR